MAAKSTTRWTFQKTGCLVAFILFRHHLKEELFPTFPTVFRMESKKRLKPKSEFENETHDLLHRNSMANISSSALNENINSYGMVEQHPSWLLNPKLRTFLLYCLYVQTRVCFEVDSSLLYFFRPAYFSGNFFNQYVYQVGAVCSGCPRGQCDGQALCRWWAVVICRWPPFTA